MRETDENVELLINEGINFLQNQIECLDVENKNLKVSFNAYLKKYSPLDVYEIINKISENKEIKEIINIFDDINTSFKNKYNELTNKNIYSKNIIKDVFYDYTYMLANNLDFNHDLSENFIDWCENGEIYKNRVDEGFLSEKDSIKEIELMKEVANTLDEFTFKLDTIYKHCKEYKKIEESEEM